LHKQICRGKTKTRRELNRVLEMIEKHLSSEKDQSSDCLGCKREFPIQKLFFLECGHLYCLKCTVIF
jgi:rRNA maturation endonuclease Nob1